jgi:hypothetical protein
MNGLHRVIWKTSLIQNRLAGLVLRLMQRGQNLSAITEAMAEIDRRLSKNPTRQGESRADFERILIVDPLAVTYDVIEEEFLVYVLTLVHRPLVDDS